MELQQLRQVVALADHRSFVRADDLAHRLRSRTLDFFVADASLLTGEPNLEMTPMPVQHPVYFSTAPWLYL